jgi:hypothetical protein
MPPASCSRRSANDWKTPVAVVKASVGRSPAAKRLARSRVARKVCRARSSGRTSGCVVTCRSEPSAVSGRPSSSHASIVARRRSRRPRIDLDGTRTRALISRTGVRKSVSPYVEPSTAANPDVRSPYAGAVRARRDDMTPATAIEPAILLVSAVLSLNAGTATLRRLRLGRPSRRASAPTTRAGRS